MTEEAAGLPMSPRVFAILLLLAREPCHGYRLMQDLRAGIAGESWVVGPATLYRTLRDLELRGWIRGKEGEAGSSGGPPRREYRLTDTGRKVASAEVARMTRLVGVAVRQQLVTPG